MINAAKPAAPLSPNARVAQAFDALPAQPQAGTLTADQLKLSKPVAPRLDQVPAAVQKPGFLAKAALAVTLLGGSGLLMTSAISLAAGMGPVGALVIGMGALGVGAMGLLGWGVLKQ